VTPHATLGTVADVKGGWLEHEIRSLPQVLACSIQPDDVVVLVDPSADPARVEQEVSDVLRQAGVTLPVRVYGGERPIFVEPLRIRNGKAALVGSIGGAAILAAGVWLAGATTALRTPKGRTTVITLAPPLPRRVVLIPVVGGDGASAPLPTQEDTPPLLRPVRRAVFARPHHPAPMPGPAPGGTPAPPPPSPAPQPPSLLDVGNLLERIVPGSLR